MAMFPNDVVRGSYDCERPYDDLRSATTSARSRLIAAVVPAAIQSLECRMALICFTIPSEPASVRTWTNSKQSSPIRLIDLIRRYAIADLIIRMPVDIYCLHYNCPTDYQDRPSAGRKVAGKRIRIASGERSQSSRRVEHGPESGRSTANLTI